jgi:pimeloyl-ACP methyl ester carboxylesterase
MEYDSDFIEYYANTSFGKLYCMRHHGYGKKLVFLHGVGASTRSWKRLVSYLDDDFDVTLIDLLGHGKSDAPHINYTIEVQTEAVSEALILLEITESCMIGHSYGGWITALLAESNIISKAVLADSVGLEEYFTDIISSPEIEEKTERMFKNLELMNNKMYVMKSIFQNEHIKKGMLTKDDLRRINIPTLLIWGSQDNTVPIKYANIFLSNIKNSSLIQIQGAYHDSHYTHAKEFADALVNFVGRQQQTK